ncbi:MAG TPA: hypothetical protein VFS97_02435 [Nitrososphaeraceae archaeon]|nr:hypothetical protein [Nitrososphaeraceae archaeon]
MVTVIKFSDTIPPQEYEKKRDNVIVQDAFVSLPCLNDSLKLDENLPPAYLVGRMMDEGILDNGAFYDINSNNKRNMTIGYRLKR